MERSAVRKHLRHLHRALVNSRAVLEKVSTLVNDKWMKDLFFPLSYRRTIMMNTLEREPGTLGIRDKLGPKADRVFERHAEDLRDTRPARRSMVHCEHEVGDLVHDLKELMFQPGMSERLRQTILLLLNEGEQDRDDLHLIKSTRASLRA